MVCRGPVLAHLRQYWPEGFSFLPEGLTVKTCNEQVLLIFLVLSKCGFNLHYCQIIARKNCFNCIKLAGHRTIFYNLQTSAGARTNCDNALKKM